MIPVLIQMKMSPPPGVSIRKLREITREAHRMVAQEWHRQFIGLHFQPPARYRYGYQPRKHKYRSYKQRIGKGTLDLVWSGLTRGAMLRHPLIRAFPNRAKISMAAPSYVSMRPKNKNRPNLGAEIVTVSSDERKTLDSVARQQITVGLNKLSVESKTITIGSR